MDEFLTSMGHSLPHRGRTLEATKARVYWKRASKRRNEITQVWMTDEYEVEYTKYIVNLLQSQQWVCSCIWDFELSKGDIMKVQTNENKYQRRRT